ncbi:ATP-binding protein [Chryseobacterium formosus]|uniref:histidine kinase n=1 Tax=Chryseobacterium formosus TaxID=1537363 RepID=A0ABT3XXL8_9FLAO|nr:ATP-binding protein [Chryseobacterium formosus]MCX8526390.1 ATP-binding protein [Chryseobacterium formosus]
MSQLVSNLLVNALIHGSSDAPILFQAETTDKYWDVSVTNKGLQIPKETLINIFHPFHRGGIENNHSGLGLGLYISSGIVKAHCGILSVTSDEHQTCFILRVRL